MVRNAAKACTRLKKYDRRRRICRRSGEPPVFFAGLEGTVHELEPPNEGPRERQNTGISPLRSGR